MFVIVDENNSVIDVASESENLARVGSGTIYEVNIPQRIMVGDEYNPLSAELTVREDRRTKSSSYMLAEIQIGAEMRRLSVKSLKDKGILPADFVDKLDIPEEVVKI